MAKNWQPIIKRHSFIGARLFVCFSALSKNNVQGFHQLVLDYF
jgi:hypothetical protein